MYAKPFSEVGPKTFPSELNRTSDAARVQDKLNNVSVSDRRQHIDYKYPLH